MSAHDLAEQDERLKDRLLNAEFSLRNMLGTVSGLFISVASLLAGISPPTPRLYLVAMITCCVTAIICVLLDFRFYRSAYAGLAFTPKDALREPAAADAYQAKLEQHRQKSRKKRRWLKPREYLCYFCLAATVVLFVVVVLKY